MSSRIRPERASGDGRLPVMTNGTAYLMILSAVQSQAGLIHGRMHGGKGDHCAIGSFFAVNKNATMPWAMVDEVAAVNDSVPHLSARLRKTHVARWLRWKLASLGYPGYARKRTRK